MKSNINYEKKITNMYVDKVDAPPTQLENNIKSSAKLADASVPLSSPLRHLSPKQVSPKNKDNAAVSGSSILNIEFSGTIT